MCETEGRRYGEIMNTGECDGKREQMLRQRDRRTKDKRGKTNTGFIFGSGSLDILRVFGLKRCTYFLQLIGNYDSLKKSRNKTKLYFVYVAIND